ncbi:MAG TPA: NAD-dependent epimerase/dehydratase family protein [Gemmatimonadota bacterium]|nr:NAD-dependent epimerase/dehydratase family protein [Gemmatimonadota bacterium]
MRVLVTGATGFVGRRLSESLVEKGYRVKALARASSDVSFLKSRGVEILYGDIRDLAAVRKAVRGCEQVYHLAASTSWPRRPAKREFHAVNVEGTANVSRAALEAGAVRLVYTSSVGVYGTYRSPVDESTGVRPDSFYRESKLAGEDLVLASYRMGLPVVIARLATVFGPGSLRWLGLSRAIAAGRFRFIGSGENHVHDVYISDVVEGLHRCAETRRIAGRCYILAGKEPVMLKELVAAIARELELDPPNSRWPAAPFVAYRRLAAVAYRRLGVEPPFSRKFDLFLDNRVFSNSRAQEELGYSPRISIPEGMRETLAWYRENGHL